MMTNALNFLIAHIRSLRFVSLSSSSLVNDSTANWRGNGSNAAAIVIVGRFVLL